MWKVLRATRGGAPPSIAENRRRKLQKSASPTPTSATIRVKTEDIAEDELLAVSRASRVSLAIARRRLLLNRHDEGMTAEAADADAAASPEPQPLPQPRDNTTTTTTTIDDDNQYPVATTTTTAAAEAAIPISTLVAVGGGQRDDGAKSPSRSPPPALVLPHIPNSNSRPSSSSSSSSTSNANTNCNSNSTPNSTSTSTSPSPPTPPSDISNSRLSPATSAASLSIYPPDEICHMALDILKRTRAKTPCFWVGQLDHPKQPYHDDLLRDDGRYDSAIALACEYQAVLPPRTFTPGSVTSDAQPLGRTIRKVKGRQSLRDIAERDEEGESVYSRPSSCSNSNYDFGGSDSYTSCNHYNHVHTSINIHNHYNHTHNYTTTQINYPSDSDTLVGSDSPPSPLTPSSPHFSHAKPSRSPSPMPIRILAPTTPPHDPSSLSRLKDTRSPAQTHASPAFQLCLDLLTAQLAQGLFKKHPAEPLDRASGLQIRLMIEAYESLLEQLRGGHIGDDEEDVPDQSTMHMQHTLDHWIRALYDVYERTVMDDTRSVDSWTSCRSSFASMPDIEAVME